MLSEHELIQAIRKDLYPQAQKIESQCLGLFNQKYTPGRGPTGLTGTNELDFTICYLRSAANLLERLRSDNKGPIGEPISNGSCAPVVQTPAAPAVAVAAKSPPDMSELYYELLYAVGKKAPGETRHETALRYIRSAEEPISDAFGGCTSATKLVDRERSQDRAHS